MTLKVTKSKYFQHLKTSLKHLGKQKLSGLSDVTTATEKSISFGDVTYYAVTTQCRKKCAKVGQLSHQHTTLPISCQP